MRVLIVGAGPNGLTAAVELARRGIHAEVIDRRQDGAQNIALSERGRRLVTSPHPSNRPAALKLIARVPVLQRRIAGTFLPE